MVSLAGLVAIALLVGPTAVFVAARARRERLLVEVALDVPTGFAVDVLSVLVLALAMPLERAVLASRLLWALGAVTLLPRLWRTGRLAMPRVVGRREAVAIATTTLVGVGTSLLLSVPYAIWDRRWHTPLVASLRGQRLPFANVYQPSTGLAYHFAGDVVAAMVQTLSLDTVHSSLALSLAHDALFGLTGLFLGLYFLGLGARRVGGIGLAVAGVLLTGPLTLFRGGAARPSAGYSGFAYETLSFRPHVAVAGLLLLGFFGAVHARSRDAAATSSTAPALVLTTALLALSDEASLGLCGLSLGLLWLVRKDSVHPSRLRGFAILLGLAVAFAGVNLLFHGALSPGAPRQQFAFPPWRVPGVDGPSLPLPSVVSLTVLAQDLWPLLAALVGGALLALRSRFRDERAPLAGLAVLSALSVFGLVGVEINRSAGESHRFMTAASLLAAFLAAGWLPRLSEERTHGTRASFAAPLVLALGLVLPAISTLEWTLDVAPTQADKDKTFFTTEALRTADCHAAVGGDFAKSPVPEYVSRPVAYLYAGCHPLFTPGTATNGWALDVGFVEGGLAALRALDRKMLKPGAPVVVVCPVERSAGAVDPVCEEALAKGDCRPAGSRVVRCSLSAADRKALLGRGRP